MNTVISEVKTSERKSVFDDFDFVGKYALSKTLRFELRPVGKTQKMLDRDDVFAKDKLRKKKYEETKPWFDKLHREFVLESLKDRRLSGLEEYKRVFDAFRQDSKNREKKECLEKEGLRLRKEIVASFDEGAMSWKNGLYKEIGFKKTDTNIFFEEKIFSLLEIRYGNEEGVKVKDEITEKEISIFSNWKNFTGYFDKFFETRKNFYKSDGTSTALATRMVDQNLQRFCDNIRTYENIKSSVDFSEVEENFAVSCEEIFSVDFYNSCLLQAGIDSYNTVIGGGVRENGEKLKGINEMVNKYRQDTGQKLPFLEMLDKQILSEKERRAFGIQNDQGLLETLRGFYENVEEKATKMRNLISDFSRNFEEYDLEKIFISKEALNTIAHRWAVHVEDFECCIFDEVKKNIKKYEALKAKGDSKIEEKEGGFSFPSFIDLSDIKRALERVSGDERMWKPRYYQDSEDTKDAPLSGGKEENGWVAFLKVLSFEMESLFFSKRKDHEAGEDEEIGYDIFKVSFQELIKKDEISLDKETKIVIKDFADSVKRIYQLGKYFAIEKKRGWIKEYELCDRFYKEPEAGYLAFYKDAYEIIVKTYDDLRNYLTKKPWSEDKWKLNFDHGVLLKGFTESKTDQSNAGTQYGAYLFRKKNDNDWQYFLGISKESHLLSFFEEKRENDGSGNSGYERLNYYQIKMASVFGVSYDGNYQEDKKKLSQKEVISKIKKALNSYIARIPKIREITEAHFDSVEDMRRSIQEFLRDNGRTFLYKKVTKRKLEVALSSKKPFYLFEIYGKDFSLRKKSERINLHTMYFKALMSDGNKAVDIGNGEIFFRPASKNLPRKKDKKGNNIIETDNLQTDFDRDFGYRLVSGKKFRYAEDKIFLHLSVELNSGCETVQQGEKQKNFFVYRFNLQTREFLSKHPEINVIGIDRGEKHLAYYSVVNRKKEILDSGSFNVIDQRDENGEIITKDKLRIVEIKSASGEITDYVLESTGEKVSGTDYKTLLEYKEKKRRIGRQTWGEVEGIKDLKKGYVSQVVRKLADLIIQHNAIIVLEDLNMRFKQIRGGIERSAYQQLEKALIDKLNYLVEKGEKDPQKAGHLLRAYQLSAPFTTFKDMGKQTGVIFYTQAEYTSITDPVTGFRKNVYISNSISNEKAKGFIQNFKKISWDKEKQSYVFVYDPVDFVEGKAKEKTFSKEWSVYANIPRIKREFKNDYWSTELVNPNEELQKLFFVWGFAGGPISDVRSAILQKVEEGSISGKRMFDGKERTFFNAFFFLFNLILSLRNSSSGENSVDFIASPVEPFFQTTFSWKGKEYPAKYVDFEKRMIAEGTRRKEILDTFNGDANGAYNIALKGLMILDRIRENPERPNLYISKADWDAYWK